MRLISALLLLLALALPSFAAPKITAARIVKVESFLTGVNLWLEKTEGDALPTGASGHFGLTTQTRLVLFDGAGLAASRNHMLATALTAFSSGSVVWFYWNDSNGEIQSLMPVQ